MTPFGTPISGPEYYYNYKQSAARRCVEQVCASTSILVVTDLQWPQGPTLGADACVAAAACRRSAFSSVSGA